MSLSIMAASLQMSEFFIFFETATPSTSLDNTTYFPVSSILQLAVGGFVLWASLTTCTSNLSPMFTLSLFLVLRYMLFLLLSRG